MKKIIVNLLKFTLVGLIFYYLSQKGFLSLEHTKRGFTQWDRLGPALGVTLATALLSFWRWNLLLKAQGIHVSYWRAAELTMVGNFFNIALPGAVSGDFVKAFYVGRDFQGSRARAFGSILFDRVVGLSALVMICSLGMIIGHQRLGESAFVSGIKLFVMSAAIAVVSSYLYLFLVNQKRDPLFQLLNWMAKKVKAFGSIARIYEGLREYHHHRFTVIKVLFISGLIHLLVCYSFLNFAWALGDQEVQLRSFMMVVPLGLLVTAIPITPAGVGTGHVAFSALFHLLNSERGADIFSMFMVTQLLVGVIGGLFYLRFKSKMPLDLKESEQEMVKV